MHLLQFSDQALPGLQLTEAISPVRCWTASTFTHCPPDFRGAKSRVWIVKTKRRAVGGALRERAGTGGGGATNTKGAIW